MTIDGSSSGIQCAGTFLGAEREALLKPMTGHVIARSGPSTRPSTRNRVAKRCVPGSLAAFGHC
jgi:hypothetical protein